MYWDASISKKNLFNDLISEMPHNVDKAFISLNNNNKKEFTVLIRWTLNYWEDHCRWFSVENFSRNFDRIVRLDEGRCSDMERWVGNSIERFDCSYSSFSSEQIVGKVELYEQKVHSFESKIRKLTDRKQ